MELKVIINGCKDCRHRDHSGAFTPGGAKPTCAHPKASRYFAPEGDPEPWHWKHRVVDLETIPERCPLAHGEPY
jgi:hypothetical protein